MKVAVRCGRLDVARELADVLRADIGGAGFQRMRTPLGLVEILALVRFYSKKQETFLFIGTGFLGTGLLNGYHAVMTSTLIADPATAFETADGAAWTWTAARLFLSMFLFGSVFLGSDDSDSARSHLNELSVYIAAAVLTIGTFLVFAFLPLPPAYYPDFVVWRPAEFIPATFFFAAWVGYLVRGEWRTEPFQYWLLISLMISVFMHGMYMSQATSEFDGIAGRTSPENCRQLERAGGADVQCFRDVPVGDDGT